MGMEGYMNYEQRQEAEKEAETHLSPREKQESKSREEAAEGFIDSTTQEILEDKAIKIEIKYEDDGEHIVGKIHGEKVDLLKSTLEDGGGDHYSGIVDKVPISFEEEARRLWDKYHKAAALINDTEISAAFRNTDAKSSEL